MRERRSATTLLTALGGIAIAVGTVLPWFRVDPLFDPVSVRFPAVYGGLVSAGFHEIDVVLLGAVATVGLVTVFAGRHLAALVTTAVGVGTVLYCAHYLLLSPSIGFRASVVPVSGWYLTVLGGHLFAGAGLASRGRTD